VAHFWPDSAWWPHVNGALASKLGIHIKVWFIIAYIFFSEYLQVGKGQIYKWVRVNGLVSGVAR